MANPGTAMSARTESTGSGMPNTLKWALAVILLAAGLVAFYVFAAQALPLRVVYVLLGAGASVGVALQTDKGRAAWDYLRESRTELRRVVWPTRKETVQTTLVVIGLVTVLAVILWMLDSLLGWAMRQILAPGA